MALAREWITCLSQCCSQHTALLPYLIHFWTFECSTDPLRSIYRSLDRAISLVKVINRELWHTVDDSCTVFAFSLQYWSMRFTPQHYICRFNLISYEMKCHLKSKRFYCYSLGIFLQDLYLPVLRSLQ